MSKRSMYNRLSWCQSRHRIGKSLLCTVLLTSMAILYAPVSVAAGEHPQSDGSSSLLPAPQEPDESPGTDRDASGIDGIRESLRDPTVPTDRILQQVPKPVQKPSQKAPVQQRRQPTAVGTPLPKIPVITLRGIAMSSAESGKAILDVDGQSISISLIPKESQNRIEIPHSQFSMFKQALKKREPESVESPKKTSDTKLQKAKFEMCLECSFTHGGLVFNLEAFSDETLLLKAVPLGELVIVRSQTSK